MNYIHKMADTIKINRDAFDDILKDRLDFGFDSIYFRYAIVRDELATLKARQSHDLELEQRCANQDKMRFYNALEQLLKAHQEEIEE